MTHLDLSLYLVLDPDLHRLRHDQDRCAPLPAARASVQLRDQHADTGRMIETGGGL